MLKAMIGLFLAPIVTNLGHDDWKVRDSTSRMVQKAGLGRPIIGLIASESSDPEIAARGRALLPGWMRLIAKTRGHAEWATLLLNHPDKFTDPSWCNCWAGDEAALSALKAACMRLNLFNPADEMTPWEARLFETNDSWLGTPENELVAGFVNEMKGRYRGERDP